MSTPPAVAPSRPLLGALLLLPFALLLAAWVGRRRRPASLARADDSGRRREPARPDVVEFFLYVPTEGDACHVATVAVGDGYDVELEQPLTYRDRWLCLLRRRLSRTSGEFEAALARIEALAADVGGELEGWGSSDEPDEDAA